MIIYENEILMPIITFPYPMPKDAHVYCLMPAMPHDVATPYSAIGAGVES